MKRTYTYNPKSFKKPALSPGDKFTNLTVIKFSHYHNFKTQAQALYVVKCDCGKIITVLGSSLKSRNTKSCGCLRKAAAKLRVLPNNLAMINAVKGYYKKHCKKAKRNFDLTDLEFQTLIFQECHYCDKKASNDYRSLGILLYNGIDRVDNSMGYTVKNCVPCCKVCNTAKSNMTQTEFLDWIKQVYNKSKNNDK